MSPSAFVAEAQKLVLHLEARGPRVERGANRLRPPDPAQARIEELERELGAHAAGLAELYAICDGLSLPDVGGGYFLHPAAAILNGIKNGEVVRISGERPDPVVVFGSDGRGGRLAVRVASGEIVYLEPGAVRLGVYEGRSRPRPIAASPSELFDRLIADLSAAISGDARHDYTM